MLLSAILAGCGNRAAVEDVTGQQWLVRIGQRSGPAAVYVWASWSRPSVELLPTILELQQEYEPRGVQFFYLSLDADSEEDARGLMREVDGPPFYRLTAPLEQAAELLGIYEPPAILAYPGDGEPPFRLESGPSEEAFSPEDAAALLDSLVFEDL